MNMGAILVLLYVIVVKILLVYTLYIYQKFSFADDHFHNSQPKLCSLTMFSLYIVTTCGKNITPMDKYIEDLKSIDSAWKEKVGLNQLNKEHKRKCSQLYTCIVFCYKEFNKNLITWTQICIAMNVYEVISLCPYAIIDNDK